MVFMLYHYKPIAQKKIDRCGHYPCGMADDLICSGPVLFIPGPVSAAGYP
jgi:hypothetical protein